MPQAQPNEAAFELVELFGFELTRQGLRAPKEKPPTAEQWQQLGDYLAWQEKSLHWLIGDWMLWGERNLGEESSQEFDPAAAAQVVGWDIEMVKQCAWVCDRVAPGRRVQGLSYSHHRVVAAMPPGEQRIALRQAKDAGWSVERFQREVGGRKDLKSDQALWLTVSCDSEKDRQRLAARMEKEGRTVRA